MTCQDLLIFAEQNGISGCLKDWEDRGETVFLGLEHSKDDIILGWERGISIVQEGDGWVGNYSQFGQTKILTDEEIKLFILDWKKDTTLRSLQKYDNIT